MWRNEKYETVPLDVKGIDEDNSKGTRDSLYPQTAVNESPKDAKLSPYFQDGLRRIDYVLTYHVQKPQSTHKQSSKSCLCCGFRREQKNPPAHEDPELAAQEQRLDYHEDDQRLRREEFEENLREMGLEMEKEEGVSPTVFSFTVGFIKICNLPENIMCERAYCDVPFCKFLSPSQGSSIVEKVNMFIQKVTAPLQPNVGENQTENEKPLSYPFSREKQHLMYVILVLSLQILYEQWASYSIFYKYQPIGLVRKYFGEKVGLYFAWLGVYTQMLIPAAIVGVIVFLYGCATVDDNIPSMEVCDERNNITMCPMCDRACSYWKLVTACGTARASHLFDNAATVFFAIFMALWATMFMEHWKRRQMRLNYIWDLTSFEDTESHPRAEYEFHVMKKSLKKEQSPKVVSVAKLIDYKSLFLFCSFVCSMQIFVTLAIVFGVVLYRVSIMTALHMSSTPTFRTNIRATVKTTAAIINLIIIILMDEVYGAIARWLTIMEVPKTDKSFEERLIFKTFILKFANAFTPIVYLAFFRGRIIGRPGKYLYVMGSYRMEECAHAGCLMELCIQLCITMLGKQLIQNNLFEIGVPKLKKMLRQRKIDKKHQEELNKTLHRHEKDHFLGPFVGLNPEYMEMIIQFGMVTLFVASFPLAPLFALLNNVIEIRLDAKKFVTELRRPIAVRAKDIGIWYTLLRGISKVAVIVNAFVIAFTSDLIPRLVYQYMYSPDGTLHGFVNHTLSYFNVSHFQPGTEPMEPMHLGYKVEVCRYKDYRDPPWSATPYEFSREFWAILAARLAFVIVFQNVVMLMSDFVDWLIPDIPKDISIQIHKERNLIVELFMKEERGKKYRNTIGDPSPQPLRSRPSSQA
uniref:Anoctamin n=1 Tax=Sinocyclocheilus rhinocerous TaxID=307959 RepID=A0A673LY54_9TELE